MFKKHNPGCPCDCANPAECLASCFCGIRIDMPAPDDVIPADGPSCPESDCEITAKCWACYQMLDGLFRKASSTRLYIDECAGSSSEATNTPLGDCDNYSLGWISTGSLACWTVANSECPDCITDTYLACQAYYSIKDLAIQLTITCADGCCTLSLTIAYTVFEVCDATTDPGEPDPVYPETRYTHTFSKSGACSCDEVQGTLTFASTSSVNNERGITVPDVCNAASATVSLVGDEDCGCICFDCLDFSNDINVALTGTDFTGTVVVSYAPQTSDPREDRSTCVYEGSGTDGDCGIGVRVTITCKPCEAYDIVVRLYYGSGTDQCIAEYTLENATCAALSGFTQTVVASGGDCVGGCDLNGFTISLS